MDDLTPATKLSIIIPAYNATGWITKCLDHLSVALQEAGDPEHEIIVVDDGSTDATAEEAAAYGSRNVTVLKQDNLGRFRARENGARSATGTHVLFLDTRVFLHPRSLAFALPRLRHRETSVWTADVQANTSGNPIARFWRAIETVFWRRYMTDPKTTSFGVEDFDYYPKGTTALIVPRILALEAMERFRPTVEDWRKVNDDTALLRYVVEQTPINISPDYSCTYNARTTLRAFLKHANHRGSVLIDGYLRPGTRLNLPIWVVLVFTPIGFVVAVSNPVLLASTVVAVPALVGATAAVLGARALDAVVLSVLFWPFSLSYLEGLYWGLWLRVKSRRR